MALMKLAERGRERMEELIGQTVNLHSMRLWFKKAQSFITSDNEFNYWPFVT